MMSSDLNFAPKLNKNNTHRTYPRANTLRLKAPGAAPNSRLNAFANAASDVYPTAFAITETLSSPRSIKLTASCIRQDVR